MTLYLAKAIVIKATQVLVLSQFLFLMQRIMLSFSVTLRFLLNRVENYIALEASYSDAKMVFSLRFVSYTLF